MKKAKDAIKKEANKNEEEKKNEKTEEKKEEMQSTSTKEITLNETGKKESKCSTCKASFENANEFRTHCKSPWHTGNLKRKNEVTIKYSLIFINNKRIKFYDNKERIKWTLIFFFFFFLNFLENKNYLINFLRNWNH